MQMNIYGELLPDRINTDESDIEISYPEQLIITFESVDNPSVANVTTTIRSHILESNKQGVQPDIVLNFCIGYFEGLHTEKSDLYIQKFITLAEYIQDIRKIDESIKITISVRGLFLKCMIPLLYINVPVRLSNFTYFEGYSGDTIKFYKGCIEKFIETNGIKIKSPFVVTENELKVHLNGVK